MTATVKNARDARLALATLTDEGEELLADATGVLDDVVPTVLERAPAVKRSRTQLLAMLGELAKA